MEDNSLGKTTIAPNVLTTIVRLTTLATPGVTRLANAAAGALRSEQQPDGVKLFYHGDEITVDVYIVITASENVRLVAEEVQKRVIRAISEMVGMQVVQVNVHVSDVDIES
ncbi:MAG TPA: Asp23/Gls24 family envelope stress response protein [Anaerolineaceae bacterium]|nr:Asp23/Gls24 family envelope stress response protein [Anaerolineaceae bacterium]